MSVTWPPGWNAVRIARSHYEVEGYSIRMVNRGPRWASTHLATGTELSPGWAMTTLAEAIDVTAMDMHARAEARPAVQEGNAMITDSDIEYRYLGEVTGVDQEAPVTLWECPKCFTPVTDPEKHDAWHTALLRLIRKESNYAIATAVHTAVSTIEGTLE